MKAAHIVVWWAHIVDRDTGLTLLMVRPVIRTSIFTQTSLISADILHQWSKKATVSTKLNVKKNIFTMGAKQDKLINYLYFNSKL